MTTPEEVQSDVTTLEQAALAHTRAASALQEAAQATEDRDAATAKQRLDSAKYFTEQAQQILDTL